MTNYNERLDELMPCDCKFLKGFAWRKGDPCEGCINGRLKQAILDWHNKQVEEAIEATEKITADIEFKAGINHATMSGEYVHRDEVAKQTEEVLDRLLEHSEDFTTFGDGGRSVAVEYIETERAKLKEVK